MRRVLLLVGLGLGLALVVNCGGAQTTAHTANHSDAGKSSDAGLATGGCTDDAQCATGEFCIRSKCGSCIGTSPLACPTGTQCNHQSGACIGQGSSGSTGTTGSGSTSGTSGTTTTSGGTTTGGQSCTHRSDCPDTEACIPGADGGAGTCGTPDPSASCVSNDGCAKTFICQAHQCVSGCYNNLDCHGSSTPVCSPGNPGQCAACTADSQCLVSESCQGGQCVPKQPCADPSDCSGGLGCVAGYCSTCTTSRDCGSGKVCDATGHCATAPAGCTSDSDCQTQHGSLAWYCDGTGACQQGCIADSQCGTPQPGCCDVSSGLTCDSTTHTCVQGQVTTSTSSTSTSGTSTSSTSSASSSSGSTGTTSTSSTGSTGSTGTTGTTSTSTTGTGSTTGSTTTGSTTTGTTGAGQICDPCTSGTDCQSGACTNTGNAAFCDSADYCSDAPTECPASASCDSNYGSCSCAAAYSYNYCGSCYSDSDCDTGGFCLGAGFFSAGSCTSPCNPDNSCPEQGAQCFIITQGNRQIGTGCYPSDGQGHATSCP